MLRFLGFYLTLSFSVSTHANQVPTWVSEVAMRNIVSMASGTVNDHSLFESLSAICEQSPLDRDICGIEASVISYHAAVRRLSHRNDIVASQSSRGPWDLRSLGIGEFEVLPSVRGPDAVMDEVVNLLLTKRRLVQRLSRTHAALQRLASGNSSIALIVQIPRLQASLHSASLVGELISLDHFLSCQPSDQTCRLLRQEIRRISRALIHSKRTQIEDVSRRFDLGVAQSPISNVSVIAKQLEAITLIQDVSKPLERESLKSLLTEISMLKAFEPVAEGSMDLLNELAVLGELEIAKGYLANRAGARNLSPVENQLLRTAVLGPIAESINSVDAGLRILGLSIEIFD